MNNRKIFGIGETVLDVILKEDKPMAAVPGGSCFNAMISLGRSIGRERPNIPIQMITETGDDHIGDIVVSFMRNNNVSTQYVTRNPGTQTHISMAFLDEKNDAQYEFYKDHKNAKVDCSRTQDLRFHKNDLLLFGSFFACNPVIRDYTASVFKAANEAETIMYYDVNFRKTHIKDLPFIIGNILENMSLSTVVRGSAEDFGYMFGTTNPKEIYEKHISKYCQLFICTDGGNPLTVITPTFTAQYPIPPIKTVSTIGAGDNFNAGFVYGLVMGDVTKEMLVDAEKPIWDELIASGMSFSAKVCQSIYNYI